MMIQIAQCAVTVEMRGRRGKELVGVGRARVGTMRGPCVRAFSGFWLSVQNRIEHIWRKYSAGKLYSQCTQYLHTFLV